MSTLPPIIRDLIWTIGSEPIVSSDPRLWPQAPWYQDLLAGYHPQLEALREDQSALEEAVKPFRFGRLGFYFEALWKYFIQTHPRYELLAYDLAVREMGRTLGSFDYLVKDLESGQTEHWEVAVKFYLGLGDISEMRNWYGPNVLDRLDLKFQKLTEQQIMLSYHPSARPVLEQRGIEVDQCRMIVKGRLFTPEADMMLPEWCNPGLEQGLWLTHSDFIRQPDKMEAQWAILGRHQWLAEQTPAAMAPLNGSDLMADMRTTSAQMLARLSPNGEELTRMFLVPDNWPKKARTARRS